jgi:hypothetical protein
MATKTPPQSCTRLPPFQILLRLAERAHQHPELSCHLLDNEKESSPQKSTQFQQSFRNTGRYPSDLLPAAEAEAMLAEDSVPTNPTAIAPGHQDWLLSKPRQRLTIRSKDTLSGTSIRQITQATWL